MSLTDELREALGAEPLRERLEAKQREYHFLIPRETAEYLLGLEVFGPRPRVLTLNMASRSPAAALLRVRAERVFPARVVERGTQLSRSQRLRVSDQSGPGTAVAYDSACAPLEEEVLSGDLLEVGPARLRGDEFHLLPGGAIRRLSKGPRAPLGADTPLIAHFEGRVEEFFGDFPVRKKSWKQKTLAPEGAGAASSGPSAPPEFGLMSSFSLRDSSGSARVVLWDSPGLKEALPPGTPVEIENGQRKGKEIHINSSGRLVFSRRREREESEQRPSIDSIEIEGGQVKVRAGAQEIRFPSLEEACARLGAGPVPEGIRPETVLALKKNEWIGKPLPKKWEPQP